LTPPGAVFMEIIFIGTGTGAPSAARAAPGMVVLASGLTILFDSGPGTIRRLTKAGLTFNSLDYIFYTHFHPDHVTDLISYLFAARYDSGFSRTAPCRIYGPRGLIQLHQHLRSAFGRYVEPPAELVKFKELPPDFSMNLGPLKVETGVIAHQPESLGYRITDERGVTAAITGDTDYSPELIAFARSADLLITECSFPEGLKRAGHLTPGLAGAAAREAGVKSLALTHFYPECDDRDMLSPARKEFPGPITLAQDLLRVRI